MADFPQIATPAEIIITPWSQWSIGVELAALASAAPASTSWATANLARFVPFVLPEPILVRKLFWMNGATVTAGNVDVGIYSEFGTKILSTGNTAQGSINVLQEVDVTDTMLGRGRYYFALSNSVASTFFAVAPSLQFAKAIGVAQMATANPLPATATFAALAASVIPFLGLSGRTLVV